MTYNKKMNTKKNYIDLHIHSTFSDGVFPPHTLVEMAHNLGLSTIAIADHDSLGAIPEALIAGKFYGIEIIPAVELSVEYNQWQDIHLLGYGIDYTNVTFKEKLDTFRQQRELRNEHILELVNQLLTSEGHAAIQLTEVRAFAQDAIGRPHIARALLEHRYVLNIEDAFRRYLKPCNVSKIYWSINDAISSIKQLGGIAVLAHPTSISNDWTELQKIMSDLMKLGLDGIETFNNMAQLEEQEYLRRFAVNNHLLMTAGSDFHGIEEGQTIGKGRGGIRFDASLLTPLKERLQI